MRRRKYFGYSDTQNLMIGIGIGTGLIVLGLLWHVKGREHIVQQVERNSEYEQEIEPTRVTPTVTMLIEPSATPVPTSKPTTRPTPTAQMMSVYVTFYGWADNGAEGGNGIAYPQSAYRQTIHETAGGTGTYDNPVTFASVESLFAIGTKLYVPYLKKYVIKEDLCPGCAASPLLQIDIWMESTGEHTSELDACEGAFTRERTMVEVNPPKGRPVTTEPLFNSESGLCRGI